MFLSLLNKKNEVKKKFKKLLKESRFGFIYEFRFSSRHLSFHSPSESSPSTTLYYKLYEGSNVVNPIEEGHHTERESPNSSTFIKNNDRLEKSKR